MLLSLGSEGGSASPVASVEATGKHFWAVTVASGLSLLRSQLKIRGCGASRAGQRAECFSITVWDLTLCLAESKFSKEAPYVGARECP